MYRERLQVLLSSEQRRWLRAEAKRRGASVGSLVREAIDARFHRTARDERMKAVEEIGRMRGRPLTVAEMDRIVAEEREAQAPGRPHR